MKRRAFALAVPALVALAACSPSTQRQSAEQPISVTPQVLASLSALRAQEKFADLPGRDPSIERARLQGFINELLDRLLKGLPANPRKSWVLGEMEPTVRSFYLEDTEARERCVDYLEQILHIVGIESANGAFAKYFITL